MLSRILLKWKYSRAARRRLRNKSEGLGLLARQGWKPDVVLDIGAGYGTRGLMDPWPDAHVILVEPQPELRDAMAAAARKLPSAKFVSAAAGAVEGTMTLESGVSIPVMTVDQILAEQGKSTASRRILLKVDVDGPECDVIRGAKKTLLENDCVAVVECVLNDRTRARFTDIILLMRELGYEVTDILEAIFREHDDYLWQVDCLFTKAAGELRRHLIFHSTHG